MPEEITGEPTIEWLCSGHVVRIEPFRQSRSVPKKDILRSAKQVQKGAGLGIQTIQTKNR